MARVDSLSLRTWCISIFSEVPQTVQVLSSTALDMKVIFAYFSKRAMGFMSVKLVRWKVLGLDKGTSGKDAIILSFLSLISISFPNLVNTLLAVFSLSLEAKVSTQEYFNIYVFYQGYRSYPQRNSTCSILTISVKSV